MDIFKKILLLFAIFGFLYIPFANASNIKNCSNCNNNKNTNQFQNNEFDKLNIFSTILGSKSKKDKKSIKSKKSLIKKKNNKLNLTNDDLNKAYYYYNKGDFKKSFDYSKLTCTEQFLDCELVATLIINGRSNDNEIYKLSHSAKELLAIEYLELGSENGDDKSTAMLFDLYNRPLAINSDFQKAQKFLNYLLSKNNEVSKIRKNLECFSNRELNPLKLLFNNCNHVCVWSKKYIRESKTLDIASYYALEKAIKSNTCKNYDPHSFDFPKFSYTNIHKNKLRKKQKSFDNSYAQKKQVFHKKTFSRTEIGSGFFVSKFGHIITNHHVVNKCNKISVGNDYNERISADLIAFDKHNDLAVIQTKYLKFASKETETFIERLSIQILPIVSGGLMRSEDVSGGEEILVAGYPLGNMVSDTIKVTKGIVSATKGMGNDVSQFEIDAVIRKGNSGGPVYDKRGNIVGVAVSRLNVNRTDTINFGIKGSTVKQFLSAHDIPTKWSNRKDNIDTMDIYKIASKQTVMVVCHR